MKIFMLITTLAIVSTSYASAASSIPVEMSCTTQGSSEPVVEVLNYFNMGTYLLTFKLEGKIVKLPSQKFENGFALSNHLYNASLKNISGQQFEFSVYEAELNGNGKVLISPTEVICTKPTN